MHLRSWLRRRYLLRSLLWWGCLLSLRHMGIKDRLCARLIAANESLYVSL